MHHAIKCKKNYPDRVLVINARAIDLTAGFPGSLVFFAFGAGFGGIAQCCTKCYCKLNDMPLRNRVSNFVPRLIMLLRTIEAYSHDFYRSST